MDFSKAFKKPFTDMGKLVIGVVLSLFPIVNWFARGFLFECSGLGKAKPSDKMPEWKNWGDLFFRGFVSRVITFIYILPALIVFLIGAGGLIISLIATATGAALPFGGSIGDFSNFLPFLIALIPFLILSGILLLLASYLLPIAILNFLKTGKFGSAFTFSEIKKTAFTGDYFVAWLLAKVLAIILYVILFRVILIGPAFTFFVVNAFAYTLYGDIYRKATKDKKSK